MSKSRFSRSPCKRVHIWDINNGYISDNEEGFKQLVLNNGEQLSCVRVLGIITGKYSRGLDNETKEADNELSQQPYVSLELDDGTDVINIKGWGENAIILNKFMVGDIVEILGRPREFNNVKYLAFQYGNLIKDLHWILLHELLILRESLTEQLAVDEVRNQIDTVISEGGSLFSNDEETTSSHSDEQPLTLEEKIIMILNESPHDEGVSIKLIKSNVNSLDDEQIKRVLLKLVEEGLIYEAEPGLYKKL